MKQMTFPPFLKEGDKVIIVSPASKMDANMLKGTKKILESWGLKAEIAKNAGRSMASFAGTIKQRTEDFQSAMDDPQARAILCSRGGYGAVHLVGNLDFTKFRQSPKWLIGFSDISALHGLFQTNGYASLHAPMGRHLCMEAKDDPASMYLKEILFGKIPQYTVKTHKLNKLGSAEGIMRGGNLAVFFGLRGTAYDFPAEGTILFIEDVNEPPHAIERMMYNLKLGGVLERISGLVIGQFTEYEEPEKMGRDLYNVLDDIVKKYKIPISFDFPIGHVTANYPIICGAKAEFVVAKKEVTLRFTEV